MERFVILFYFQAHSLYTLLSLMAIEDTNPRSGKKDGLLLTAIIIARVSACLYQFLSLSSLRVLR